MPEELPIQIVDKKDNPIGTSSKKFAREKGQVHRVSRIFLENSGGDILLQKRTNLIDYPGRWDSSASGHVDGGEDYKTAAERELAEELGISDLKLNEIGYYYSEYYYGDILLKRFNKVYKGKIDSTPTNFDQREVEEVKWFDRNTLKRLIEERPDDFVPGIIEVMKKYY